MSKSKRKIAYENNKRAKVGIEITCPICGTKFIKRQYSQAFCCSKCKGAFWNARKALYARKALVNDEDFRRYVMDDCDVCDIPKCNVDLATLYENYLGID
ncbi:MAG: hypothetical protein UIG52_00545 [Bacteroidales bacterium]|nr:hypothetical protein [Bacteroidales bacterium]